MELRHLRCFLAVAEEQLARAGKLFLDHVPRVFAALQQARDSVKAAALSSCWAVAAGEDIWDKNQRCYRCPQGAPFSPKHHGVALAKDSLWFFIVKNRSRI